MHNDPNLSSLLEMLANRIKKRSKHLNKWARRYGTNCLRVYDRDIPEIPLVIEVYARAVVVYNFSDDVDKRSPRQWCPVIASALNLPLDQVFWKTRSKQKGTDQYERLAQSERQIEVNELDYKFLINPRDYLDTGLFLDHRVTRDLATRDVKGKRVLNLFAYTGSFSVYAAARGARFVTTVDMSNTYLEWAKENFVLNGLSPYHHEFIQTDVLEWLKSQIGRRAKYDLLILDPPTFSNSKRMSKHFDVQRDHGEIIGQCRQLLTHEGELWFSTNKRRFKLDAKIQEDWTIEDLSPKTQPEDFRKRPHQCWRLTQKEAVK